MVGRWGQRLSASGRIPNKVKQLDRIAKLQDRSRNYIVNQAIDQLLELHAWQNERVKEGINAADQGRFASDADMARILDKYINA